MTKEKEKCCEKCYYQSSVTEKDDTKKVFPGCSFQKMPGRCCYHPTQPSNWEERFEEILPLEAIAVPGKNLLRQDVKSFIHQVEKEAEQRGYEKGMEARK